MPRLKFKITFKRGPSTIAVVDGFKEVDTEALSVADMEEILLLEQKLEKLTGFRTHIESQQIQSNDLIEVGPRRRLSREETLEKYSARDESDI